ncbi:hypothetical protein [Thalassotalea sp. PLHSN55]|uniref:hypothetical protein n=1 Tax=Thalassotalea sp. PLHSN55 TaxID=3435888 RepID=UPI003F83C13F
MFAAHGNYLIENNGDCLKIEATGPFNKEVIDNFHAELKSYISELTHKNWQQLIIMKEMSLFTPEAEQALCHTLDYRINNGLSVSAIVVESIYHSFIKQQLSRCYAKYSINHAFFTEVNEAKIWIEQQL